MVVLLRANLVLGALSTPLHSLSTLIQAMIAPAIKRDLLEGYGAYF